jgi:hypothetical protein
MNFASLNTRDDTRGINVSKRIAFTMVVLLLLLQAVPVMACVAMPAQALTTCCCDPSRDCAMSSHGKTCAGPEACCVQASGTTPALSIAAAHPDDRPVALPIAHGAPPANNLAAANEQRAHRDAVHLYYYGSAPLPAVPLYLRHLRLTL